MAGTNTTVRTVVRSGTNIYVGGEFSSVGNVVARNVAQWDGTSWSSLGTGAANGANGPVYALVVAGSDLYVGGRFTQAGGISARSVAKWNGTSWSGLGAGIDSNSSQPSRVQALAMLGPDLYVGGNFTLAGSVSANSVAKWDGNAWSGLGSGLNNGVSGSIPDVDALAVIGTNLYVGGSFNAAGGVAASRIAKWDGSTWSALGSGIGTLTNGGVWALLPVGTDLYVGGGFTVAGGVTVDCLAKWNGSNWSRVGGAGFANGNSNGIVTGLAFVGTELYISGAFSQSAGAVASYMARWDGTTWRGVGTGLSGDFSAVAYAVLAVGNEVYVGGKFITAGGRRADNIARWDGNAWNSLAPNTPIANGLDGIVFSLAVTSNNTVYAGGLFQQAGGIAAEGIARWNGSGWSSLTSGVFSGGMQVRAIAVAGNDVYVGGIFYNVGAVPANYVAKWNGSSWSSLGSGASNGVNGFVYALAVIGSDVYVGGGFTQAGGNPASYIAKWSGTSWSSLGQGSANGVGIGSPFAAAVQALAVVGPDLYVGGYFNRAGATTVSNIARWNGTTWSGVGSGVNGSVLALAVAGPTVYAGGYFNQAGGAPANQVARWDGTTWSSLGTGPANGLTSPGYVQALAVAGSDLYVGGYFNQAGGAATQNLAKWNGSSWSSLGTGANNAVYALAALGSQLYAGGAFTAVGDENKVLNSFGIYDPSSPTAATGAALPAAVSLCPNPASEQVTFSLPPTDKPRRVQLLDVRGQLLREVHLAAGAPSVKLPVSGLPTGVYLLRCGQSTQRLMVP
ncbi:T9SS type A sorting domain-containing protein [Hymenobacter sp. BT662]|uniref:T9SS type A sorting domain-containing protein n=2 Tax=Hymenobacter ruricola TaxID=2791023 RepID=A0ABS0HXY2_9BACT|nr:T9SS type A sorting domain-containing protein [Hymenobacter ruricola]